MKIMVVADGRSPITRGWVKDLLGTGHEVFLVSSFPHETIPGTKATEVLPVAFSRFSGSQAGQTVSKSNSEMKQQTWHVKLLKKYRFVFQQLRYWLGPLTLVVYQPKFRRLVSDYEPDLIHALRIPFEGMLALSAPKRYPLVVSIWGNDLTLHAPKNFLMRNLTRKVLSRSSGLITDVNRDLQLASTWGFNLVKKPYMVALTSGGIDIDQMEKMNDFDVFKIDTGDWPIIINPRGIRPGYVRNDTFFASIPHFLQHWQKPIMFVCPSMEGQTEAEQWVSGNRIEKHVKLLPFLSQEELWALFQRAAIMVSITEHDGTPNSLLESMAFGAFPIVGDIESLREWIVQGENGILVDPNDPEGLATAMFNAMNDVALREKAASINRTLVEERADRAVIRKSREAFYSQILNHPAE